MTDHNNNNDNGGTPPVPAAPAAPPPHKPGPQQVKAAYEQQQEREGFRKRLREAETVRKVFAEHPIKLRVSPDDVYRSVGTVKFDADGQPYVGNHIPLHQAITNYADAHAFTVAESPLQAHDPQSLITSKAEFKNAAERSEYIERFGITSFEALPLQAPKPVTPETMVTSDFKRLTYEQKSALAEANGGWDYIARLQREAAERTRKQTLANQPTAEEIRLAKLRGVPVENLIRQRKATK